MSVSISARSRGSFRVGRVTIYQRGQVWYLRYVEHGQRRQVRASTDKAAARQLASQVNVQLETGIPASTSFEPVSVEDLRIKWLEHHECVKRSSVQTIKRYRTATLHLVRFLRVECRHVQKASQLGPREAEAFARWLRTIEVAPNGHKHSAKRRLLDKGILYILQACRSLFQYAIKRRHLPPYSENPFSAIEIESITVENAKPIVLLSVEEERAVLKACDAWEYPILLVLLLTGMRPGELCHLLLDDVDLGAGVIRVRNKPRLGWQIKTRCERVIPLHPFLVAELRRHIGDRRAGSLFEQKRVGRGFAPPLRSHTIEMLERESARRVAVAERRAGQLLERDAVLAIQRRMWRDVGSIDEDDVRAAFTRVCRMVGMPHQTAPKVLRHGFATMLQDANVDPIVRNLLMGHSTSGHGSSIAMSPSLGMTAVYTHTRSETVRKQLIDAINQRHGWMTEWQPLPAPATPAGSEPSPIPPPAYSAPEAC